MKKRILSFIIIAVMLVCVFPSVSFAGSYDVDASPVGGNAEVYIDGVPYVTDASGHIAVASPDCSFMTVYVYNSGSSYAAAHSQYPVSMKVYAMTLNGNTYSISLISSFNDILKYCGASIKASGEKGIRIITGVPQTVRDALASGGLEGYTLAEYGTCIAYASKITDSNPLVLGGSGVVSNYAYKAGVADAVYKNQDGQIKYTNPLVKFTDEQCKKDLVMRPYMILNNTSSGKSSVIYGGIVCRSIEYIASQNVNSFPAGSAGYYYIQQLIGNTSAGLADADNKNLAHQGVKDAAPGNTAVSFELAGQSGVFWAIETDLRMSADGVLFCSHAEYADENLNGSHVKLSSMTWNDISQLVYVSDKHMNVINAYPGQPVASFSDYLDICKKYGCVALVEFKSYSSKLVKSAIDMINAKGMLGSAIFQSSNVNCIAAVKSYYPSAVTWLVVADITAENAAKAASSGCVCVNGYNKCTAEGVALANQYGLKVAWSVYSDKERSRLRGVGVNYFLLNEAF